MNDINITKYCRILEEGLIIPRLAKEGERIAKNITVVGFELDLGNTDMTVINIHGGI